MPARPAVRPQPLYARLWFQVIVGIVVGVVLGQLNPGLGASMRPLGDAFVKLIRMMIAPIIFGTVVVGIAKMGDMKEVGRIGLRALIYFEAVSTLALIIGLVFVNVMQPGAGMHASAAQLNDMPYKHGGPALAPCTPNWCGSSRPRRVTASGL